MPTTTGELDAVTALIDDHRQRLVASLDGLTEEEVRRRLVPSRTTLLDRVRHLAFVEVVYFHEGITGTPRAGYGLGTTPHASFGLAATDTVASVVARYREIVEGSRRNVVGLSPDDGLDRGRTVAACTCRSCASSPSTRGTRTSCASSSSPPAISR